MRMGNNQCWLVIDVFQYPPDQSLDYFGLFIYTKGIKFFKFSETHLVSTCWNNQAIRVSIFFNFMAKNQLGCIRVGFCKTLLKSQPI